MSLIFSFKLIKRRDTPYFNRYSFQALSPEWWKFLFCTIQLKLWDVEIFVVSRVIPRNLIPLTIVIPNSRGSQVTTYFIFSTS